MSDLPEDEELAPDPAAEEDHASPESWMVPARLEGHEWGDIGDHVAQASTDALNEGHSQEDVDRYLGYKGTDTTHQRATDSWAGYFAAAPDALASVAKGALDLFAGDWRADYAKSLRENETKSPQDFADAYGAGALTAAHAEGNLPDPTQAEEDTRKRSVAAAAEAMAGVLPSRHDFVDGSLALTGDQDVGDRVRNNLISHWQQTGEHPSAAAIRATKDDTFRETLSGTAMGSFVHGAEEGLLPGLGGLMAGAAVGSLFAGPVGTVVGGVAGALGGAMAVSWAQNEVLRAFPDTARWLGLDEKTQKWDEENHPYLRFGGTLAGGSAALSPFSAAGSTFGQRFAARAISSALQGGVEGGTEYFTQDGKIDWTKVSLAAGSGTLFPNLNPIGQHIAIFGPHTGFNQAGELTTRVTDFATPEGHRDVPFVEAVHDPLLHAEAQEIAREPGFASRLATSESGKLDLAGQGGDVEAKKRPTFALKEPEVAEGQTAPQPGEPRSLEIHSDGEKIGSIRVSYPEEGHAFIDSITAGKIGERNPMGARGMRSVLEDFFKMHPDVNVVDGWHVSGSNRAASRDAEGKMMSIDRAQLERKPKAAEVQDIAQGYHAAAAAYADMNRNVGSLMRDESGALTLWRKPRNGSHEDPARVADAKRFFDAQYRTTKGNIGAKMISFDNALEPFYKDVNPHMATFDKMHDASTIDWTHPVANLYRYLEGRSGGSKLNSNSKFGPLADTFREQNEWMREQKQIAEEKGLITPKMEYDDYFRHYLKNPASGESMFQANGKLGSGASYRGREYPTLAVALNAGEQLKVTNPIDSHKIGVLQGSIFLSRANMAHEAIEAGWGKWGKQDPGTSPLPDLTNAKGERAYMNDGYVKLWTNVHSQGFFATKMGQEGYDTARRLANQLTMIKLANPVVHLTQVNLGVMGEMLGEGMADVAKGQLLRALYHTVSSVPLVGPTLKYAEGKFVAQARFEKFLAGNHDEAIEYLVGANPAYFSKSGRGTQDELSGSHGSLWQNIGRNFGGDTIGEKFGNMFKAAAKHEWDQWSTALTGKDDEVAAKTLTMMPFRMMGNVINDAGSILHTATNAVFGNGKVALIPNIQKGVALDMMTSAIKRNPDMTHEQKVRTAIQITNEIENRLGELNQDNAYFNKSAKQMANLTMLSSGWKFGTYAWIAQAFGRNIRSGTWEFDPVSMRSTVGALAAWGALTGAAGYLFNGSLPWQTDTPVKDMIWFRTGGAQNKGGTPRRGQIFGEQKELIDIAKALYSSAGDPMHSPAAFKDYLLGATNPMWQVARGLMTGEDAIGHRISQYPGGWKRFMTEQLDPIMLTAAQQEHKGVNIPDWMQENLGFRDAPEFGQDPDTYQKKLAGIRGKWTKEEMGRARREAASLEHPEWLQQYIKEANEHAHATGGGLTLTHRSKKKSF